MRLSPGEFNRFLNHIGQNTDWKRAYDCPCRDPHSHAAKPDCPVCSSTGVLWDAAVAGKVGLAGQKVQRQWAQFGLWEAGDVVVSIPSDSALYAMGEFDRVVFTDSSEPFSITLIRGDLDTLRFQVASIDRVFWLAGDTVAEGGIPTVSAAGVMTWATGEPQAGAQYSLTGRKRPEYFCFGEFPQDRAHHGGLSLPRRVVLRKFDLFGRSL